MKVFIDPAHGDRERLVNAVCAGDLETMSSVLDRNPELVNATADLERRLRPSDTSAMRLLHLAVAENRIEAGRLLVARGANLNTRNADCRLPLHDCLELGRDEFATFLLSAGAEADVCAAAAYGLHHRLRQILDRDPQQANDLQTGVSALGWSAYGNQPESARILLEYGAAVDRQPYDAQAWDPAAQVASLGVARVLLEKGANPNCRNDAGDTPMHVAIKSRIVRDPAAFIELLLTSGADRAILNNDGRTALDEALLQTAKQLAPTIELLC